MNRGMLNNPMTRFPQFLIAAALGLVVIPMNAASAQTAPGTPPSSLPKPSTPGMPGRNAPPPGQLPGGGGGSGGGKSGAKTAEQLVTITATADVASVKPGQEFHLAFIFDIEPQWHIYWKNSGASGAPTEIEISGPSGFEIGAMKFPRPLIHQGEEGTTYGYENKVVLYVPVTAPAETNVSQAMFNARITYLVCKDICLMGRASKQITVSVRSIDTAPSLATKPDPVIEEFKKQLPRPLSENTRAEVSFKDGSLTVRLPSNGHTAGQFFPLPMQGVEFGEPAMEKDGEDLVFTVPVEIKRNNAGGKAIKIAGAVGLGDKLTGTHWEFSVDG